MKKYLERYAEPEIQVWAATVSSTWDCGVVLPLYQESTRPRHTVEKLIESSKTQRQRVLILAIINQKTTDASAVSESNQLTWDTLKQFGTVNQLTDDLYQVTTERADILLVDRFITRKFHPKQGVGLARKLGCDLLCLLISQNKIVSPLIRTTDGDALPAADYLRPIPCKPSVSAYMYPFKHHTDSSESGRALAAYDRYLHYYVSGLKQAGSPYAFHTVGSTLAIPAPFYAQVRGFPKKLAGEDFYLLNKLAKLGNVTTLPFSPLTLANRTSTRVPFGTGAAQAKILHEGVSNYRVLNPHLFEVLGDTLEQAKAVLLDDKSAEKTFPPPIWEPLKALGMDNVIEDLLKHRKHPQDRIRQFHVHFDALKTLRFLHLLERDYPRVPLPENLS